MQFFKLFAIFLLTFVLANAYNLNSEENVSKLHNLTSRVDLLKTRLKDIKAELTHKYGQKKLLWQVQAFTNWYQDEDQQGCLRDLSYIFDGWTPVQRRLDGSENFYRNWSDYQQGFGDKRKEFFLGLQELYNLTHNNAQELLIILGDYEKKIAYAKYDNFVVGSSDESYAIKELGNYVGTAGDALTAYIGQKFTTLDRDNDSSEMYNCAKLWRGAWWFGYCYQSHLNGPYLPKPSSELGEKGIVWDLWHGLNYSLKFSLMLVRQKI